MDTLPIIIVTAVVTALINGAVSVAIFLRVQKNIELSFQKQLEAFKSELQKDVVEHQVKFSRSYPKTAETLEEIHKQLISITLMLKKLPVRRVDKVERKEFDTKVEDVVSALQDYQSYITYHRVYLPDEFAKKVTDILNKTRQLCFIIQECKKFTGVGVPQYVIFLIEVSEFDSLKEVKGDPQSEGADWDYINLAFYELEQMELELDQLYKSVT